MRSLTLAAAATLITASASAQAPAGWEKISQDDTYGAVYSLDGSEDGTRMMIKTVAEIEASCSCDLSKEGGGDRAEMMLFGLSTMWLDIVDHREKGARLLGAAETEYGTQDYAAAFQGSGKTAKLIVIMTPPGGTATQVAPRKQAAKAAPKAKPVKQVASTSGAYTAPIIKANAQSVHYISNWPNEGYVQVARKNDKYAPRLQTRTIKGSAAKNPKKSMNEAFAAMGLKNARIAKIEQIEMAMKMMGSRVHVAFGTAKRNGKHVRFYANYRVGKGQSTATVQVYDAPKDEYVAWGGVAVPLSLVGVYQSKDFTAASLKQAGALSPVEEAAIFEDHYQAKMIALFQGTMAVQMGTLNNMRSFNMATGTCAGMENCTVEGDGLGGFQADVK